MKDLMIGKLQLSRKRKLMDTRILPILTDPRKVVLYQRRMERSILGKKLSDRVQNSILRFKTRGPEMELGLTTHVN